MAKLQKPSAKPSQHYHSLRAPPRDAENNEVNILPPSRSSAQNPTPLFRQSSVAKGKAATAESKAMAAASGPSRVEDEDVEIMDVEYKHEAPSSDHDDQMDLAHDDRDGGADEDPDENALSVPTADEDGAPAGLLNGVAGLPRCFAGLNESAAMAIFADYRQLGTYMSGLSSRLKTMLTNIKSNADPTTQVPISQSTFWKPALSTHYTKSHRRPPVLPSQKQRTRRCAEQTRSRWWTRQHDRHAEPRPSPQGSGRGSVESHHRASPTVTKR